MLSRTNAVLCTKNRDERVQSCVCASYKVAGVSFATVVSTDMTRSKGFCVDTNVIDLLNAVTKIRFDNWSPYRTLAVTRS